MSRRREFDARLEGEFRRWLLESREMLLSAVLATDEAIAQLERPGPGDSADRAAGSSLAALVSRLAGQGKEELDEIAAALRRLGSGVYGVCVSCRAPIPLARQRAVPATRLCLTCQAADGVTP
jgi:RNA polymerase-binding transcription factor